MFASCEVEEINHLLKRILRDNEDVIQDVWAKILEGSITDRSQMAYMARKARSYASHNAIYKESRFVSMNEPLPYCDNLTRENFLASPEEEDSSEYETRAFQDSTIGGSSHYGSPRAVEALINREYKVECKFCESTNVVKNGRRGMRNGAQYWLCRTCGRGFTANGALPKMRYPKYILREAVRMRLEGYTLEAIKQRLYAMYKIDVRGTGLLCRWFKELKVSPPIHDSHRRRDPDDLKESLVLKLRQGVAYSSRAVLDACGYNLGTDLTRTQLFKRGMIHRHNGGWMVDGTIW